jgi:hypothetical protein
MHAILAPMVSQLGQDAFPGSPPLLEAKLAQPRIRAGVIRRQRLFAALDRLSDVELTVLSGPAGSGKTVLVSSWLTDGANSRRRGSRSIRATTTLCGYLGGRLIVSAATLDVEFTEMRAAKRLA